MWGKRGVEAQRQCRCAGDDKFKCFACFVVAPNPTPFPSLSRTVKMCGMPTTKAATVDNSLGQDMQGAQHTGQEKELPLGDQHVAVFVGKSTQGNRGALQVM